MQIELLLRIAGVGVLTWAVGSVLRQAGREELAEAEKGIVKLGGRIESVTDSTLYLTDKQEARCLIAVRKEKYTPGAYPRAFAKIKKAPL